MELENVAYLEDIDFNGKTLIPSKERPDKVFFVGIMSNGCGHCVKAKPEVQKFANKVLKGLDYKQNLDKGNIVVCCIATDNKEPSVKKLSAKLKDCVEGFAGGIPFFCCFKNGKMVGVVSGERTAENFEKACTNHL